MPGPDRPFRQGMLTYEDNPQHANEGWRNFKMLVYLGVGIGLLCTAINFGGSPVASTGSGSVSINGVQTTKIVYENTLDIPSEGCLTEIQFIEKVQADVELEGQMEPGWARKETNGVEWCPPR